MWMTPYVFILAQLDFVCPVSFNPPTGKLVLWASKVHTQTSFFNMILLLFFYENCVSIYELPPSSLKICRTVEFFHFNTVHVYIFVLLAFVNNGFTT